VALRVYLDDCAYSKLLARLLRDAGHEVVTPFEVGISGAHDDIHFEYARTHSLVLPTKNPADFEELHQQQPDHPGILAVYQDNSPHDMSDFEIVQTVKNLLDADCPIAGEFIPLNHWQY
jgi:predicted nuclease of predicted toxin-antitoxin system